MCCGSNLAERTQNAPLVQRHCTVNDQAKLTRVNDQAIRRVLETAGVEFIDADGGGPGVRLRHAQKES
jgi:hypothetical protein